MTLRKRTIYNSVKKFTSSQNERVSEDVFYSPPKKSPNPKTASLARKNLKIFTKE